MFASGLVQEPFVAGAGTQIAHVVIRFAKRITGFACRISTTPVYLTRFASSLGNQCKISKNKLAISTMAVTPATDSFNACVYTLALHDQNPIQKS